MKKIIINVIMAIMSLAVMYVMVFSDLAFVKQLDGFVWFDAIVLAFIVFGINLGKIISYLDPEEEV